MSSVNEAIAEDYASSAAQDADPQDAKAQLRLLKALILEIGQAQDLQAALKAVVKTVCQHQKWQYGEAWQLDRESRTLQKCSAWYATTSATQTNGSFSDPGRFSQLSDDYRFAIASGIPGRVWLSQQSEWHTDVSKASASVFLRYREAAECGFKAALGVPLVASQSSLAVLVFLSDQAISEDPHLVESINVMSKAIGLLVQQRQAEEALRNTEARFHAFMNNSQTMAFMKDAEGRFAYINQPMEKAFNVTQAELIGKTGAAFLSEETAQQVYQNDLRVLQTNQSQTIIEVVPTSDGVNRSWQVTKFPFTDSTGERFVGGIAFDVTQQKQSEEKLAAEKELAQVTLRSIGDAVITTDASGRVRYLNPVAEKLTGWSQTEAEGELLSKIFNIIHESTRQPAVNPVTRALHDRRMVRLANHTVLIARDGTETSIEDLAVPIQTADGRLVGAVMVFHDVSETRLLAQQLSWQASHDVLTSLLNRREFERRVMEAVDNAHAHQKVHALCYLDLDNFKIINDTCGHAAGDRLLKQVSTLLGKHIRTADTLARLGGDEFGLLLEYCQLDQAARLVYELKDKLQALRFVCDNRAFSIGVSIGVTTITAATSSAATALSNADAACHVAKRKGRNRIHIHQLDDADLAQQRSEIQWAAYLAEALETNRFQLYYQPILSLNPACSEGEHYEVLLRLRNRRGVLVTPDAFIPAAERYDLMPSIDRWVIQTLFADQSRHYQQVWHQSQTQPHSGSYLYSINLSGASINDDEFIHFLKAQFLRYEIPTSLICFEITETAAITNLSKAAKFINELRALGCQFALDDFGSGMSSFAYLKTLPIDYLKIDGRFIQNMIDDEIDLVMVTAIHQIAQVMDIRTVAEFVENEDTLTVLRSLGIDYAQGYGIARPAPLRASPPL